MQSTITPDLILDAIALRLNSDEETHKKLVTEFIKLNDETTGNNVGMAESLDAISQLYMDILKNIHTENITKEDNQSVLSTLLKYEASPVVQKDPAILSTLRQLFTLDTKLSNKKIDRLATKISNSLDVNMASTLIRHMFNKLVKCEQTTDPDTRSSYLQKIIDDGRTLVDTLVNSKNQLENTTDRYLEHINMNDKEDIRKAIRQYSKRKNHVFKTGLQGLNKMFGKAGGFKLGESITINALKHNYKSGLLMSFAKWIVMHNKPPYVDPENNGIPTILFITLENEANENIMWWFESMYVATHGKAPEGLSDDEIVDLVYHFFQDSGYDLIIERKLGPDFGYEEYVQMYERYQKAGHRILVTIIDYMNMMKKSVGGKDGRSDLALRDLYNKMCNFNKNRMTTQISAHQLNRDAARLTVGTTNVVKKFNDSHYADGMDVGREVDMEIFIHIERNNSGTPYLTMMRGKHRYVNDTPEKDKYCAYKFEEWGIPDDINEEKSRAVKNIYAEDVSEEEMIAKVKSDNDEPTKVIDNIF